jgi:hypothetical protein
MTLEQMKIESLNFLIFASLLAMFVARSATAADIVNGNLINFQPDGAWSWYQDERVIVSSGQVILGSVAAKNEGDLPGGGFSRDPGDVIASTYNMTTGRRSYFELNDSIPSNDGTGPDEVDDHNAPSFLTLPDGRILSSYTGHSADNFLRFRTTINAGDTSSWSAETTFTRTDTAVTGENDTTYTNLHYLPNEGTGQGRIYNFFRNELAESWDRHFVYSDDLGDNWAYGGQLTGENITRRRPYTKFVDDGNGRIYYTATEDEASNPNSIWVGYIENGQTHRLDGTVVDGNIFDDDARPVNQLSLVLAADSVVAGVSMQRLWNRDIALDDAGNPVITFRGYANGDSNDSRHLYARWTGTAWNVSQIAIGGGRFNSLDANERSGSGQGSPTGTTIDSKLAVLDPNNPNIVYFASQYDPLTQTLLTSTADNRPHFEMFRAVTPDSGLTWSYEQLTVNSSVDNVRPTVASTHDGTTVLTWMRGAHDKWDYVPGASWYAWDTAIVGLVLGVPEAQTPITYVDADLTNTKLADGTPWSLGSNYSSDGNPGNTEGLWHFRNSGTFGNGGTLFTSNERSPYNEDAPVLRTSVEPDDPGLYDVWVTFWSPSRHPDEWRLQASLDYNRDGDYTDEQLIALERFGSQGSALSDFVSIEKVEESGGRRLYRGYLGRLAIELGDSIDVFIDDLSNTDAVSIPGVNFPATSWRTWYDGIGFALVGLAGDFNGDGTVDAADYTVWRDSVGSTQPTLADGNLDGVVDAADYLIWRTNFGRELSANIATSVSAVPEPSAAVFVLVACQLFAVCRGRVAMVCRSTPSIEVGNFSLA